MLSYTERKWRMGMTSKEDKQPDISLARCLLYDAPPAIAFITFSDTGKAGRMSYYFSAQE